MTGIERARYERINGGAETDGAEPATRAAPDTRLRYESDRSSPEAAEPAGDVPPGVLFAGPGVKLKGEISACEVFRVEGHVDVKVAARQLFVSKNGTFSGVAEVGDAEIEGTLDGTLDVHGRLLVRGSGRVTGKVCYNEIEIERGGELSGEVIREKSESANRVSLAAAQTEAAMTRAVPRSDGEPARRRAAGEASSERDALPPDPTHVQAAVVQMPPPGTYAPAKPANKRARHGSAENTRPGRKGILRALRLRR